MASKGKSKATDSPYWGKLPPVVPTKMMGNRQNGEASGLGNERWSSQQSEPQPYRQNRASTQSEAPTVSTQSPYASPTSMSFNQTDGLKPRPPSFASGGNKDGYEKDFIDKRRRRESRDREYYEPTNQKPTSTRRPVDASIQSSHTQGLGNGEYTRNAQSVSRSQSVRQPRDTTNPTTSSSSRAAGHQRSKSTRAGAYTNADDPVILDDRQRRRSRPVEQTVEAALSRHTSQNGESTRSQQGKQSGSGTNANKRREWAPDRSPLQRLELTLDSITKEEKRARVEEAELLAREAKAGRGGVRAQQGSVRSKNRPSEKAADGTTEQTQPKNLAEAGLVRSLSNKQKEQLQQSTTTDRPRKSLADTTRGFDYEPLRDDVEPGIKQQDSNVAGKGANQRNRTVAHVATAASATAAAVAAKELNRSNSNKLRKEPPGDPWYSRRTEAENRARKSLNGPSSAERRTSTDKGRSGAPPIEVEPRISANGNGSIPRGKQTISSLSGDSDSMSDDSLLARPIRRNQSKKIEQMMGIEVPRQASTVPGNARSKEQPVANNQVTTVNGVRYAVPPMSNEETFEDPNTAPRRPDGHRHISDIIHLGHKQHDSNGVYRPTERLDDWKKGEVAALTAGLLDLDVKQTESEKDKAWWEQSRTERRKGGSTRRRKVEALDGENGTDNGTTCAHSSLSSLEMFNTEPANLSLLDAHKWSKTPEVVAPPARYFIGFQGTSYSRLKVKRRNRTWKSHNTSQPDILHPDTPQPADDRSSNFFTSFLSISHLSPRSYLQSLIYPIQRRIFLDNKKLTTRTRFIRTRSHTVSSIFTPPLYLKCGPLLRYCGLRQEKLPPRTGTSGIQMKETWRGSVLIVTSDSDSSYDTPPTLRLFAQPIDLLPIPPAQADGGFENLAPEDIDPIAGLPKIGRAGATKYVRPVEHLPEAKDLSRDETDAGLFESKRSMYDSTGNPDEAHHPKNSFAGRSMRMKPDGERLGRYKDVRGVRLHTEFVSTFWRFNIEVELTSKEQRIAYKINRGPATGFWVPAAGEAMNIMFHSCNGFSMSATADEFSGPDPMWRDVLNSHQSRPFHVMIGGGDQIYNDAVSEQTTLFRDWLQMKNPHHKENTPFTREMQTELEEFYFERYCMWFSQGLFGVANSQIPMVNIYDDHDIIDGFGSYPFHFMKSPVFSGLGNVAFKYYMLFQHQSVIDEGEETEPSWLLGAQPGPFITELSRSVFISLGGDVAFLGLDCRTERTRDDIMTEDTYDRVFDRCESELIRGQTKHLIILLGIPVAYPRLVWLENILTSRLMDPVKAIGKSGMLGGFLNKFDGGVEILDDLDDHWTAKNHKEERNWFIQDLQELAAEKSVRITILGGDVHLAAIGQFYSNPKLGIPKDKDYRYMPNIISSAIVNTPPPEMMADVLNKRNKVHHLDHNTDEDMIPIFTHDVSGAKRNNKRLLPRRNWCSIREYQPGFTPPPTPSISSEERSPSPPPPARGGLFRHLSNSKGPAYKVDGRPPPSGGLMRRFSLSTRPRDFNSDSEDPNKLSRSTSLTRREFFPTSLFRRASTKNKQREDEINGYGSETPDSLSPDEEYPPRRMRMRGGSGGEDDDGYFQPRPSTDRKPAAPDPKAFTSAGERLPIAKAHVPDAVGGSIHSQQPERPVRSAFHRTPTGLSEKQLRKGGHEIDLQGGLEICLNVEISQKDPAGITVPYRLLVPALRFEDDLSGDRPLHAHHHNDRKGGNAGGIKRLLSIGKSGR